MSLGNLTYFAMLVASGSRRAERLVAGVVVATVALSIEVEHVVRTLGRLSR